MWSIRLPWGGEDPLRGRASAMIGDNTTESEATLQPTGLHQNHLTDSYPPFPKKYSTCLVPPRRSATNVMAQNSTSLCTFSTLEDAYKAIQSTATSVEDLVNQCPNVCTLAYGNGNPDLSGLGVRNILPLYHLDYLLHLTVTDCDSR
jgi:hypothetical protein